MTVKVENKLWNDALLSTTDVKKNGSGGDFGSLLKHAETQQSDAAAELEKYVKMTPGERMALAIRKQLGISEDAYNSMTPDQKMAVDAKVAQILKQKMEAQTANSQGASGSAL